MSSAQSPTIKEFTRQVETRFGKPLNQKALIAAKEFHRHWDDIQQGTKENRLAFKLDPVIFGYKYAERMPSGIWKRIAFGAVLAGVVLMIWNWVAGLALFVAGVAGVVAHKAMCDQSIQAFSRNLLGQLNEESAQEGMVELATLYILGILTLKSPNGQSHWPQYPSDVFTGEKRFIAF